MDLTVSRPLDNFIYFQCFKNTFDSKLPSGNFLDFAALIYFYDS